MYDLIIKNGKIIDGTGAGWYRGDVAISGDRIAAVGTRLEGAERIIDASGLFVSPGFIDAHSHSDGAILINPRAESKIRQGVTTEVIGQCGTSAAPREKLNAEMKAMLAEQGLELSSLTMKDYLQLVEERGSAVNIVPLIGHGTVREEVMGYDNRPCTPAELEKMKALVAQAMEDGAFGMTTGLIYPPSCYGDAHEMHELARVVASYGGFYATHMRNEADGLLQSIEETLEVARQAGLPVHISHYKVCGEDNWGKSTQGFELIEAARRNGLEVTLDQYPYTATSNALKSMIPSWAHEGGNEGLRRCLEDAELRARIRQEMLAAGHVWDKVLVSRCRHSENKQYEGRNLVEIGQMMGMEPVDATLELLLSDDFQCQRIRFAMDEDEVARIMQHPLVMIGSDASCLATTGPLSQGKPHPRAYGTFARVLGHYVREKQVLRLEEAVRKMTSLPAGRFGLWHRGLIRPGFFADITIFDAERIIDRATFTEPHQYADGIEYVIVNGQLAVEKGEHTGNLPGRALRKNTKN